MFPYQGLKDCLMLDFAGSINTSLLEGPILSDMSLLEARCHALNGSFYKKLAPNGRSDEADKLAYDKFVSLNSSISADPFEYPVESEQDSLFWDYFRDNILKCLTPSDVTFDLAYMRETVAAGPGASKGCENESFYTKLFNSRITATSPYLLSLYRAVISESDSWSNAEMLRHKKFGEVFTSSNRLFFVPKTAVISRTCCTEPLVNMLFQQALGAFLEECLAKSFGISLKTQATFNRELARIGSEDGSFGTIDLQSASDSISWSLVQRIVPSSLLGYFRHFRCESTDLPNGGEMDLRMISTMGNGFTFPLQTIIFACALRSVYQLMNLDSYCPKTQFGVFGDDIIVRREAYNFLVASLSKLGFKVNDAKSFNTGPFRESCGGDYFCGHFIRGVYITSLETVTDVYSAINRLNRWSALAGVPLVNTIGFLMARCRRRLVPLSEQIDCGIQVPFKLTKPIVDDRYWFVYRKAFKAPRRREVPEDLEGSVRLGYAHYNEYGWAVTYLGGYARREDSPLQSEMPAPREERSIRTPRAFLGLRDLDGDSRIKVIRKSIPWWDWPGSTEMNEEPGYKFDAYALNNTHFFSYSSWEAAVAANTEGC